MNRSHLYPSLNKIIEGCSEFQAAADELIGSGEFRDTFVFQLNALVKELRDVKLKCLELKR